MAGAGAAVVTEMGAVLPLVVLGAAAEVVGVEVEAGCSVLARVGLAVVHVQLTQVAREAGWAEAAERVELVLALPVVQTGRARTLVHLLLTAAARVPWRACAVVAIHQVRASPTILALTMAVVNVDVAVGTAPTRQAVAVVAAHQVSARLGVHTRLPLALVRIELTGAAHPLWQAPALKIVEPITARSSIPARIRGTVIDVI